jgi:hypothetical protein
MIIPSSSGSRSARCAARAQSRGHALESTPQKLISSESAEQRLSPDWRAAPHGRVTCQSARHETITTRTQTPGQTPTSLPPNGGFNSLRCLDRFQHRRRTTPTYISISILVWMDTMGEGGYHLPP